MSQQGSADRVSHRTRDRCAGRRGRTARPRRRAKPTRHWKSLPDRPRPRPAAVAARTFRGVGAFERGQGIALNTVDLGARTCSPGKDGLAVKHTSGNGLWIQSKARRQVLP